MAKKTSADKGDKAEKGSASVDKNTGDKTPVEAPKETVHQEPVELEPYTPTGNFEADFCELCIRAGFPSMQVVPRPHRPPTPSPIPQDSTPVTGKGGSKDGQYYHLFREVPPGPFPATKRKRLHAPRYLDFHWPRKTRR